MQIAGSELLSMISKLGRQHTSDPKRLANNTFVNPVIHYTKLIALAHSIAIATIAAVRNAVTT